ncbi:MAG: formate dehydrogenase [Hyphomicrobiaceae bacterium]|nr:formate dehydrogenase [Hyphomicrobiaceae bacterium]
MKKTDEKAITDRRSFLKLAGAGVAAGGAAAAAGAPATAAEDKSREGLYRETDHVKRYYELARF